MIILWLVKGQNILNPEKIIDVFFQNQDKGQNFDGCLLTSDLYSFHDEKREVKVSIESKE